MDECSAKLAVVEAGKRLLHSGLVARTWGNVSCRTGEDEFVITPSGLGYDGMQPGDIVLYRMADGSCEGARKPSSEKGVHAAAYAAFPDAGFVIHTHQCYASALGLCGFDSLALSGEDLTLLGGAALAPYGLPSTKKLCANVAAALRSGAHCVLMAHHGALIVGRDADEAFMRAEKLEALCKAACHGQPANTPCDATALAALTDTLRGCLPCIDHTASPAVVAAARNKAITAQLDDMAQMIGRTLVVVEPETQALVDALKKHGAVLVKGLGAIAAAYSEGDADALCRLVEKACVASLHTRASGVKATLSPFDTALMRQIYKQKYAKKIGG